MTAIIVAKGVAVRGSNYQVVVALGIVGLVGSAVAAGQAPQAAASLPASPTTAQPLPTQTAEQKSWHRSMSRTVPARQGCFKAKYPDTDWQEVPCQIAPQHPYMPKSAVRPDTVGNGTDYSATTTGLYSSAEGSFESVVGVTSENDSGNSNYFSLQLNMQFFTTSVCNGISGCQGWQQFLLTNPAYSVSGVSLGVAQAFMQYWLLNYGTTCPSGWNQDGDDCWKNSAATSISLLTISEQGLLTVAGQASSGGVDTVTVSTGNEIYSASGEDTVLNLASGWKGAEFNVVGDGGASAATFNTGSTIVVKTTVDDGTANAPSCAAECFTGETNNLTLVTSPKACCPVGGSSPAIVFLESNATGAALSCSASWLIPVLDLLLQ